jgi:hypothetical protein
MLFACTIIQDTMITNGRGKRSDRTNSGVGSLIILTLKKHVNGIWITKLVERLKESVPHSSSFQQIEISIRSIEDWLAEGWLISDKAESDDNRGILGIVNRVSDAASPSLFKACCAVLATAEQSLKIPVWNGSSAYSLCGNKWRHHLLFRQAKLLAPTTMVYYAGHDSGEGESTVDKNFRKEKTINVDTNLFRQNTNGRIEILVKPNAGGFGAGIKKISLPSPSPSPSNAAAPSTSRKTTTISIPSSFEDGMALVQQYEKPRDGKIYRVWFLNGKVQCAVERSVNGGSETGKDSVGVSSSTEFTSGCAGGNSCKFSGSAHPKNANASNNNNENPLKNNHKLASTLSIPPQSFGSSANPPSMLPWEVPEEVRQEIEDCLLPLLVDAHCGSVEFLYASSTTPKTSGDINRNGDNEEMGRKPNYGVSNESTIQPSDPIRRLYFDLNLLSTLPIIDDMNTVRDGIAGETVWQKNFDPWFELAHGIWQFCMAENEKQAWNE